MSEHHSDSQHQDHSEEKLHTDMGNTGKDSEREAILDELERQMFERAQPDRLEP